MEYVNKGASLSQQIGIFQGECILFRGNMKIGPSPPLQAPSVLPSIIYSLKGNGFELNFVNFIFFWMGGGEFEDFIFLFCSVLEMNIRQLQLHIDIMDKIYCSAIYEQLKKTRISSLFNLSRQM